MLRKKLWEPSSRFLLSCNNPTALMPGLSSWSPGRRISHIPPGWQISACRDLLPSQIPRGKGKVCVLINVLQVVVFLQEKQPQTGAHQMEPPSLLISWVNPFPSRFINRTIFFCNALESRECSSCLLSFLYFHWLFPLSARETSSGNSSIYKSTLERVDSKGLCRRWRLNLMGSCC